MVTIKQKKKLEEKSFRLLLTAGTWDSVTSKKKDPPFYFYTSRREVVKKKITQPVNRKLNTGNRKNRNNI